MDDISVDMIVKAITQGFDSLSNDLKTAEKSTTKLNSSIDKTSSSGKKSSSIISLLKGNVVKLASSLGLATAGYDLLKKAIQGSIDFMKQSLQVASDTQELMNKYGVVFGNTASSVSAELDKFASDANRSKIELKGMASTLQDTFVPMGFTREEAAGLSVQMTKLATDVASFNNSADADVMRDFQSAIVGNHETVRKYGIVITQNALSQELMNMGIKGGVTAASEYDKVMARVNLILKGTVDAHNDAIKTAQSYENVTKGLTAAWQDYQNSVGEGMVPTATKSKKALSDVVKQATRNREAVNELKKAEQTGIITKKEYKQLTEDLARVGEYGAQTEEYLAKKYAESQANLQDYNSAMDEHKQFVDAMAETTTGLAVAEDEAIPVVYEYANAQSKNADILDDVARSLADASANAITLSESLKGATGVQVAQMMIDQLLQTMREHPEAADDIMNEIMQIEDEWGLASERSRELSEGMLLITDAIDKGTIAREDVNEAFSYLYENAGYANDTIGSLKQKFIDLPAELDNTSSGLSDLVDEIREGAIPAWDEMLSLASSFMALPDSKHFKVTFETTTITNDPQQTSNGGATNLPEIPGVDLVETTDENAAGGSFIIPGGFNNDKALVPVSSGEEVSVIPTAQTRKSQPDNTQLLMAISALPRAFAKEVANQMTIRNM